MTEFEFGVFGNRLTGAMPVVPSGNVATVELFFTFSDDWEGLAIRAAFVKDGVTFEQTVENGSVHIPTEVTAKEGVFEFGVIGYTMVGGEVVTRISTNRIAGRVIEGAYASGMVPGHAEDDPSDWERMMNHLDDFENPHKVESEQLEDDPKLYGKVEIEQSRDEESPSGAAVEVWGAFGNSTKITPDGIVLDENGGGVENLRDPYADTDAIPKGWADNHYISTDGGTVGGDMIVEGLVSGLRGEFGIAEVSNVDTDNGNAVVNVNTVRSMMPPAVTVDTAMSDTSANAVQNKVIKAYVDSHGGGGTEKKYELIEDRTLTEETRTVTFEKYADNTPYKLAGLLVKVYTPAQPNLAAANDIIFCKVYFWSRRIDMRADASLSKTAEGYVVFGRYEMARGFWSAEPTRTHTNSTVAMRIATNAMENYDSVMAFTDNDSVTKIEVEASKTTSYFPVGANFKIYGIKAD